MAEVAAIINSRPLVPVSTNPDDPFILTPNALLTQKVTTAPVPAGDWVKNLHSRQWCRVQHLAQTFWDKWKKQYLTLLQPKRKGPSSKPNLEPGSIVLLKDEQQKNEWMAMNEWPMRRVTQVFPSKDNKVRKVEVKVFKKEGPKVFIQLITKTIFLLTPEKLD